MNAVTDFPQAMKQKITSDSKVLVLTVCPPLRFGYKKDMDAELIDSQN